MENTIEAPTENRITTKYTLRYKSSPHSAGKIVGIYNSREEAQSQMDKIYPFPDSDRYLAIREVPNAKMELCGKYKMVQHADGSIHLYYFGGFLPQGKGWKARAGYVYAADRGRGHPRFVSVNAYSYPEAEMLAAEAFNKFDDAAAEFDRLYKK